MARPLLLTAGATRNRVDAIRYLSAHATGQTGVALARRLSGHGLDVHLLGSVEACLRAELDALRHPDAPAPTRETFEGTRDLMARVEAWLRRNPRGVLVHSAAVGDYEQAALPPGKIASGAAELVLRMVPAPKIVDHVRTWAPDCVLVSFKAADPRVDAAELEAIARAQATRTGSDLVFANVLGHTERDVLVLDGAAARWHATRASALDDLCAWLRMRAG
jgi:phosphopantothenoylcysteine decarboxylase/phosphopantothenate--cysteine ligase